MAVAAAALGSLAAVGLWGAGCTKATNQNGAPAAAPPAEANTVQLKESQLGAVKLDTVNAQTFELRRTAVGAIDFDENNAVQIYPPYPGRILQAFADLGNDVVRGQPLYTIDSPDLLQAESTLIASAGVADLTAAALQRAKDLYAHEGLAQKDYEQAVSDQMAAEGALKAARDAVRIFGKSEAEIDAIIAKRKVDSALIVHSPVSGRVTARFAQPGLFVQPGSAPAPFAVADISRLWMVAYVPEADLASIRPGESLTVTVPALGNSQFKSTVKTVGQSVDPSTHTAIVRAELRDPDHRLTPGMLASFAIDVGSPLSSPAIPVNGIVREGDGTMSAWVTSDRRKFTRRTVTIGLQQGGFDQILSGVNAGEVAVVDGAILLSNMLFGGGGDD
jgi:cobalt-zinc-cadmium efflux system membrane fusion protein